MHARVVELDALADAVWPRTENQDRRLVARCNLSLFVVGGVVVRGTCLELGRTRIDCLVHRLNAKTFAQCADISFFDRVAVSGSQARELDVGEAMALGVSQQFLSQLRGATNFVGDLVDEFDLVEEPRVNVGRFMNLRVCCPRPQCELYFIEATVTRHAHLLKEPGNVNAVLARRPGKSGTALFDASECLLQGFGEIAADRHRLSDALHRRGQRLIRIGELLEREPRHLHDDVIQRRFKCGRRFASDVVGDLIERVPNGKFRGDLGDREASGFRRKGR